MLLEQIASPASALLGGVTLPRRMDRLAELAYNLWWSWNPDAVELFNMIDPLLWVECYHNPVKFLRNVKRKALKAAIHDKRCLERYDRVMAAFDAYLRANGTWYSRTSPDRAEHPRACLS